MKPSVYLSNFASVIFSLLLFIILKVKTSNGYFSPSELQLCDGDRLHTFKKKFCPGNKLVFTDNSTKLNSDCICFNGIWLVINRDCVSTILTSRKGGCILSPQIKALQYLGAIGISDDFFTVITKSKKEFTYKVLRPVQNVFVQGQIWIYNGELYKSDADVDNDLVVYCATRQSNKLKKKVMSRYFLEGKLSVQDECSSKYDIRVSPQVEYQVVEERTSECTLSCQDLSKSKVKMHNPIIQFDHKVYFKKPHPFLNKTLNKLKKRNKIIPTGSKIPKRLMSFNSHNNHHDEQSEHESMKEKQVKNLVRSFNEKLLRTALSFAFEPKKKRKRERMHLQELFESNQTLEEKNFTRIVPEEPRYPVTSFKILERLHQIVEKTCPKAISKRYLYLGHLMLKSVYEIRGSNLMEKLKEAEAIQIFKFLNDCYASVQPIHVSAGCADIDLVNSSGNSRSNMFYNRQRHLTLEIPWKIIDLTVGVCIKSFAPSYIMYHKMEQAMEKIFTKDLRTLWKRPPEQEVFYTRLYGPNWKYYLEKLEACITAVYKMNPKLSRLRRPDELNELPSHPAEDHFNFVTNSTSSKSTSFQKFLKVPPLVPSRYQTEGISRGSLVIPSANLKCQPFEMKECFA